MRRKRAEFAPGSMISAVYARSAKNQIGNHVMNAHRATSMIFPANLEPGKQLRHGCPRETRAAHSSMYPKLANCRTGMVATTLTSKTIATDCQAMRTKNRNHPTINKPNSFVHFNSCFAKFNTTLARYQGHSSFGPQLRILDFIGQIRFAAPIVFGPFCLRPQLSSKTAKRLNLKFFARTLKEDSVPSRIILLNRLANASPMPSTFKVF